ncbi:MAG TPA: hypothetical protein PLO16_15015 [Acidocella sp.]|nr:hypothetical protein [Acidocella sp.]
MNDLFATLGHLTLPDTRNATSSPGLGYGRTRCAKPVGMTPDLFGQDHALASLSALRELEPGSTTSGICGPNFTGLSRQDALSALLGSKLKARLEGRGSTLYRLTWKEAVTPSGRRYYALRASAPRTSDTGGSGWPTPTVKKESGGATIDPAKVLARALGGHANDLQDFVQLAAGWATPKAEDSEQTGFSAKRLTAGKTPDNLHSQTKTLVGWATPATRDYRTPNHQPYAERGGGTKGEQLNNQAAHLILGASLNGSTASTENRGLLNPAFSRWLQGIPASWDDCAPTAMRSTRKSPKSL